MELKLKIDLHVHTIHSNDAISPVRDIILGAKKAGLDGIAITDHNTTEGLDEARKEGKRHGIIVIRGQETRTKEGDVIALGPGKCIPKWQPVKKTIDDIHKMGGVAVAAHPYREIAHNTSISGYLDCGFDAVEVVNSRSFFTNKKAKRKTEMLGLAKTAGSDAHRAEDVGNAYTIVAVKSKTEKDILDAIRAGKTEPVLARYTSAYAFAVCVLGILLRKLKRL
ncbi:MAG: histidinol-phosphatase [Candidatus Aenigmatarchaeota archaeon]|nr:MAG: histidinol-phosphatase [Candidatus Aenigmarchaeota archaeon]